MRPAAENRLHTNPEYGKKPPDRLPFSKIPAMGEKFSQKNRIFLMTDGNAPSSASSGYCGELMTAGKATAFLLALRASGR
ncbi:hypothetical protein HMPREF3038_00153 [Akkermansia sp. KLE1797]|nr:hypothetical protein HMPREF3038_00153 [Akkermansia sp. KLE1797]